MGKAKAPAKMGHRVVGLTLSDVKLKYLPYDSEKEPDAEFDYGVEIDELELREDIILFSCEISVRKIYKDGNTGSASVSASYFCGITGAMEKSGEMTAVAKKYAQTSIWSAFTSLFAICSQQMGVSFPVLPPVPARVDLKSSEEVAT